MSIKTGTKMVTKEETAPNVKICHPSVCVGGTQPTSCVCPTKPEK